MHNPLGHHGCATITVEHEQSSPKTIRRCACLGVIYAVLLTILTVVAFVLIAHQQEEVKSLKAELATLSISPSPSTSNSTSTQYEAKLRAIDSEIDLLSTLVTSVQSHVTSFHTDTSNRISELASTVTFLDHRIDSRFNTLEPEIAQQIAESAEALRDDYNRDINSANGNLRQQVLASIQEVVANQEATIQDFVNGNCHLFLGWINNCNGCSRDPPKYGVVTGNDCDHVGTDTTCHIIEKAGIDFWVYGLNFDGTVDGTDKLYIGFKCTGA